MGERNTYIFELIYLFLTDLTDVTGYNDYRWWDGGKLIEYYLFCLAFLYDFLYLFLPCFLTDWLNVTGIDRHWWRDAGWRVGK